MNSDIKLIANKSILFVFENPFNPSIGGTERVTDLLTKALIKRGYYIYYLCGKVNNQKLLEYDFPTIQYQLPCDGLFSNEENKKFYKHIIETHNIDIVVNQSGYHPSLNNCLNVDCKKISVIHYNPKALLEIKKDILDRKNNNNLKYYIKVLLYPYLKYLVKVRTKRFIQNHYKFISQNSDAIVLLSNKYIPDFKELISINNIKATITGIPNPNTFKENNIDLSKKENIILYVGRLSIDDKNPLRLLKVWELLYKKNPDWKLVLVGEGISENQLKEYVRINNIERVYFEGRQLDVTSYYKKGSFICLTSNTEGWPMTLMEGMGFGCIPITFNNYKTASDIIDSGINGYLIEPFNVKKYAKKIQQIIIHREKRELISLAAYKKSKIFDLDMVITQWEELFNSI